MSKTLTRSTYWGARTLLTWLIALIAYVACAVAVPGFSSAGNLYALMQVFATLALVSAGLAVVMITGEFDLSIAATFPLAGLITVQYADELGLALSVAVGVGSALLIGLVNGLATGAVRIASLAVTVATMMLGIGLGYLVTGNNVVTMADYQPGLELTEPLLGVLSRQSVLQLALVALLIVVVKRAWWGRFLYAIGSDGIRARSTGLPVTSSVVAALVLCAGCAGIGGALEGVALATGQPGPNNAYLLQAATAVLIGGIALTGGRGSLVGAVGGALLLAILNNGLSLGGVASATIQLVNGVVLVVVVICDRPLRRLVQRGSQRLVIAEGQTASAATAAESTTLDEGSR
ncbi:ABC transporter permease [Mycolicibacterium baixiangningiae]|uniref:ABC transporter permease n=1 Tax=Mycolicibacterium baixiangningiae TaxID=2761578 RepID=UPI001866655C|nr:ABC transporter permease [Mycolicibacterium baixiangningiae]